VFGEAGPSERKLELLREKGIVPYSKFATRAVVFIAVGIWLLGSGSRISLLIQETRNLINNQDEGLEETVDILLSLLLVPAAAAAAAIILVGLLQTKFLFNPLRLGFSLSKLNATPRNRFAAAAKRAAAGAGALALCALFSAVSARLLFPRVLGMLFQSPASALRRTIEGFLGGAPFVLAGLAVAAFAGWLVARLSFMIVHAMTREELEAERREEG